MKKTILILNIINVLLLSAHVLRHFGLLWAFIPFVAFFFYSFRSPVGDSFWFIFYLAAITIWSFALAEFVRFRLAMNLPVLRLVFIMGAVILVNLIAESYYLKKIYKPFFKRS